MNVVNNHTSHHQHHEYRNRVEQGREGDDQMEVDEKDKEEGNEIENEPNADQDGQAQDLDRSHLHAHFSIRQNLSIHPQPLFPSPSSSTSTSSSSFSNPNVYSINTHIATTLTSESNQSNSDNNNNNNNDSVIHKTDNQRLVASSPSYTHIGHNHSSSDPTSVQHAQSLPPTLTNTQIPFTGQSYPTPTPVPISQSTPSHNNNRPVPLRLTSSASSSSASSIRSARRLNHSPYIIPQTAKLISPSPKMNTPNGLITVKDEPRTPVPLPSSPLFEVKNEPIDHTELLSTPQASRSVHSGRIGSSPGSMSMSQRRGVRPAFPSPRMIRTGSAQSNSNNGIGSTRGLLTPQYSSSSSSSKHPPYPSPIPLISAPLSPPPGTGSAQPGAQRWHQSAPAVPLSATIPLTNQNGKSKSTPNPYQVSLDEIPKDFVLKKLVQLASKYWYAPHSADCHIIVPIKRASRSPAIPSTPRTAIPPLHQRLFTQPHVPQTANNGGPILHAQPGDSFFGPSTPTIASIQAAAQADGGGEIKPDVLSSSVTTMEGNRDISGGRRGSLPGGNQLEQCLVFPLHKDYLTTQSVLFRTLLNSQAAHLPNPPPRDSEGRLIFQSPVIRGAKVLPTKSDRPKALYVPLPDPASFGVILHWLYWHDADHFNHCLSKGLVTWQGVIRNIEYLSLDNEIKLLAGKWWKRWVKPTEPTERRKATSVVPSLSSKGKGKRRAFSTSAAAAAKREINMNIDDDDDDDDEEYEEGEEDSGDEADDEDIEVLNGRHIKVKKEDEGLADHVSLRLGRL